MKITMAHGSGGQATSELIDSIFAKAFDNPVLSKMEDSAVVEGAGKLAVTTDSFVVTPLFFAGGDIGRLCVCGTVNDLLMSGAVPKYLTCGFVLEEGADTQDLERIAASMAAAAEEAGVQIVAGDTKVIEGQGGLFINTAGVGFVAETTQLSSAACREGDVVIVSGNLGDHHAAILSARMGIENTIVSDCAPLSEMVSALQKEGVELHALRDITRGGLATVLGEFARASHCCMELWEQNIPVSEQVRGFCGILGLDPLYMGNEGKLVAVLPERDARRALSILHSSRYGEYAALIGRVSVKKRDTVLLHTPVGGLRVLGELYGEGLPRIC